MKQRMSQLHLWDRVSQPLIWWCIDPMLFGGLLGRIQWLGLQGMMLTCGAWGLWIVVFLWKHRLWLEDIKWRIISYSLILNQPDLDSAPLFCSREPLVLASLLLQLQIHNHIQISLSTLLCLYCFIFCFFSFFFKHHFILKQNYTFLYPNLWPWLHLLSYCNARSTL